VKILNGLCITDAVKQFGVTSKTLRYYERVGLLEAKRADNNNYRYYDEAEVERIKQIMILRKMQISIKDIIRIYENEDMSTVVEVFVSRINAIDEEVGALTELKRITNDFLQTMIQNGITKISAIPLLYEEMDKQLNELEERKPVTAEDLATVSEKLAKPLNISILDLPPMRVLTSFHRPDTKNSDYSGFLRYIQVNGLSQATSGNHRQFEFQTETGDVLMVRVSEDFINDSEYLDYTFMGGLFASVNVYLDEDLGQCFRTLVRELDTNPYYQFAYCADGTSRHPALLENLISPDDKRELVSLLVPVKKRLADPALFDKPEEIASGTINIEEIEKQNPMLWTEDVPLDSLTPINNPHYRVNDGGEAEYTGWISTRVLNTNVAVKLPFRVDIEFRLAGLDERFGYGDCEGSVVFYHGDDPGQFEGGNFGRGCGVNM
jgi:DNA-binding transcriptional MerR regulator